MYKSTAIVLLVSVGVFCDTKPIYKYRYETEDLMENAASSYPMQGYRVIERGYFPAAQFSGIAFKLALILVFSLV